MGFPRRRVRGWDGRGSDASGPRGVSVGGEQEGVQVCLRVRFRRQLGARGTGGENPAARAGPAVPGVTQGPRRLSAGGRRRPRGYYDSLEALRDPEHEEHEEYLERIGGEFDPEAFDMEEVNAALTRLR